jgi:CRISPR-associated protein (TIGR02710 family)
MTDAKAILICTVGGSHQPILTALRARQWERVVFVCTPGAGGSAIMVEEAVGTLPPIPVLAGLDPDGWELVTVPPDEPDAAFAVLVDKLRALARDLSGAEIVADFTGGTKSMSAALTLAALDAGAALQPVTGDRPDLVRVRDRTEQAIAVRTKRIAGAREIERLTAGWNRYAYQEAAEGFGRLWSDLKTEGLSREELRPLTRAKELSEAFAAWDRFEHKSAAGTLHKGVYKTLEIGGRSDWYDLASALARGQDSPWGALHLRDLWHNAQRCAGRSRHDDAVARLYRLWEATAQWLLRVDCHIDTAVIGIGLKKSWELYLHLRPGGPAAAFWNKTAPDNRTELERLDQRLSVRNHSIWAHGWNAVAEAGWNSLSQWTETGLLEVLAREAERLGERHELPQLPTDLPKLG